MPPTLKSRSRCPACGRREKRSSEQNARYWAIVARVTKDLRGDGGAEYDLRAWHAWFKFRFLGGEDVKLPNGYVMTQPKSSADEDTPEFSDYMTAVEAWAAERGVYLSE